MMERPLFRDLQSCLRWAWYGSILDGDTVKGPAWAQYQAEDKRDRDPEEKPPQSRNPDVGGVPRGLLAAGQAGAIKRHVLAMPGDEGCHVMVKFLMGAERHQARRLLRPLVADYIGLHGAERRAAGLLMASYYGRKDVTFTKIAEQVSIDRRQVSRIHTKVFITLDALELRAERRLYDVLQSRGVVQ